MLPSRTELFLRAIWELAATRATVIAGWKVGLPRLIECAPPAGLMPGARRRIQAEEGVPDVACAGVCTGHSEDGLS
jgi:hypothetical protein